MKSLIKFDSTLFLPIFILLHLTSAIDFDEGCSIDGGPGGGGSGKETSLKIAFVMDQTFSFSIAKSVFAAGMPALVVALKAFYKTVEVALTVFADWPKSAEPDVGNILEELGKPPHKIPEGCYGRRATFSTDYIDVAKTLNAIKAVANGGKENSLAALAMTVVDKTLTWNSNTTNQKVRKIAMVLTDRSYGNISKPGTRQEFKGDGTDKCLTSKPPPVSQVGDILAKNNMAVIAIIAPSTYEQNAYQWYVDHIGQLPTVPFCGKEFNLLQGFDFAKLIEFVKGCIVGFGDGEGGGGEGGTGGGGQSNQCVYGDPPGINTLGF